MSKGTYSHSNRHRMHETNQTPAWMEEHEVKAREITPEYWKTLCDIEEPVAVMVSGKQMTELMKDKERLDWLIDYAYIHFYRVDDGGEWEMELDASDARNHIDKEMEDAQ